MSNHDYIPRRADFDPEDVINPTTPITEQETDQAANGDWDKALEELLDESTVTDIAMESLREYRRPQFKNFPLLPDENYEDYLARYVTHLREKAAKKARDTRDDL